MADAGQLAGLEARPARVAPVLLDLAEVYERTGDPRAARETLGRALALSTDAGLVRLAQEVRHRLARSR